MASFLISVVVENVIREGIKYGKARKMKKNLKEYFENDVESVSVVAAATIQLELAKKIACWKLTSRCIESCKGSEAELVVLQVYEKTCNFPQTVLLVFKSKFWDESIGEAISFESIIGNIDNIDPRFHSDDGTHIIYANEASITTPVCKDPSTPPPIPGTYTITPAKDESRKFFHHAVGYNIRPVNEHRFGREPLGYYLKTHRTRQ